MKPDAYAVRNDQGFWSGIWNDRDTALHVINKGQPSHHEKLVALKIIDEPQSSNQPTERTTMNAESPITLDTPIRTALPNGDRLAGFINADGFIYAVLLPPKSVREHPAVKWNNDYGRVAGALSFYNGHANTGAMAAAGSQIAQYALERSLYIPARDELDLIYRAFKPGTHKNWGYRSGDNPSSVPAGYPHSAESPAQTSLEEFRTGGPEAIPEEWVWTSTQRAQHDDCAWCQLFSDGGQSDFRKSTELEVVLVRSMIIR